MTGADTVAYLGATVVPGDGRPPVRDAVLLVSHGRVVALGGATTPVPADATRVDVRGRWILPGLTESHAHISGFASEAYHPEVEGKFRAAPPLMESMLRWGVTTVRDTGGPDLASTQALQRHGQRWPRFFGSGPNLDGHPGGPWKGMWKTDDPVEVRDLVEIEYDAGMDFIKVYAWMNEEVMTAAIRAAHEFGLRVAGHVGGVVTAERAVEIGIDALEHVRIGRELVPEDLLPQLYALPAKPRDIMASSKPWRFVDLDSPPVERVIDLLVASGTYLTPTLAIFETHLDPDGEQAGDPSLHHHDSITGELQYDGSETEAARHEFELMQAFVGRAHAAGVRICAGSDTPSPVLTPGESLHTELGLLVQAGLTPLQAIEAATSVPARLLGHGHEIGALSNGLHADFVVLDADPLADIANTRSIESVFLGGTPAWTRDQELLPAGS
ncbi:amidohydrolase family protein [Jatrophihabitans sp. YIM 134969]